ncbi:MAG: hypothetical protein BroJett018_29210 [Chloroflexota bacterium]|nr:MAG: hypothetical protein BroJett018_29210 [Chloroflexota bacterium]
MPRLIALVILCSGLLVAGVSSGLIVARRATNDSAWLAYTPKPDLELHRVRRDGNQKVRLTSNGAYNYAPSWSPDGRWLLFSSNADGDRDVYRVNIMGRHMYQLTGQGRDGQTEEDAQFSPDGQWVTLRLWPYWAGYPAKFEIFMMRPDGSQALPLTRLSRQSVIVGSVKWSPDGQRLAVNVELPDHAGFAVYVVDVDGQNLHLWATNWQVFDWTPDGRQLMGAVYQNDDDESPRLMLMDADTPGAPILLTDALPTIQQATLAPDGDSVLVTSGCVDYQLAMCLYRLPLRGGAIPQRLTGPHRWIPFAAWSARGNWIAWVGALGQERDLGLFMMRADGRDLRRVVEEGVDQRIVWSPPIERAWAGPLWLVMGGAGILWGGWRLLLRR